MWCLEHICTEALFVCVLYFYSLNQATLLFGPLEASLTSQPRASVSRPRFPKNGWCGRF